MRKSTATLNLLAAMSATLLTGSAHAQMSPPQWDSATTFQAGGLSRGSDGNYYRALKTSTNKNPVTDPHSNWELYYVRANTILTAGSGGVFSNLKSAWPALSGAMIAPGVTVNISLSGGAGNYSETFSTPINLDHPFGGQISISGTSASKVTLNFTGSDGFVLDSGHSFGGLTGLRVLGSSGSYDGIHCTDHSTFSGMSALIDGFSNGMHADGHSQINGSGSTCKNSTGAGVRAEHGSEIRLRQANLSSSAAYAVIEAFSGACVDAQQSTISRIGMDHGIGVYVTSNATVDLENATVQSCKYGVYAVTFGMIDLEYAKLQNCTLAVDVASAGQIDATSVLLSGNGQDFAIPPNVTIANGCLILH